MQAPPTKPDLSLFDGALPAHETCTYLIHWAGIVAAPSLTLQHLVVSRISLVQHLVRDFQHEFLRIEVLNRNSK